MGYCQQEQDPEQEQFQDFTLPNLNLQQPVQEVDRGNEEIIAKQHHGAFGEDKAAVDNCFEIEQSASVSIKQATNKTNISKNFGGMMLDKNNILICENGINLINANNLNVHIPKKCDEIAVNKIVKKNVKTEEERKTLNKLGIKSKGKIVSENSLSNNNKTNEISVKDFNTLKAVGKGAFGDVFLVRKKLGPDAGSVYALKMVHKQKIEEDDYIKVHYASERNVLEQVRGAAFLSQLYYAFQTLEHLFLVMDYNSGGQLLQQFIGQNVLFENHMRVYMAELLVAVGFLHEHGIIHRDIKPENVLLSVTGHIVLIDYGLSKFTCNVTNRSHVGTVPYIAPEILLHKPHDRMADFWSLGVLGYEMVAGDPPFPLDLDDDKLIKAVLEKEPKFNPKMFHKPCKSLLSGLLQKTPKARLGAANSGGINTVKKHQFFKCVNWQAAAQGQLKPPNMPKAEDLTLYKETPFKLPKDNGFRHHFENYYFSWLQQTPSARSG